MAVLKKPFFPADVAAILQTICATARRWPPQGSLRIRFAMGSKQVTKGT